MIGDVLQYRGIDTTVTTSGTLETEFIQTADTEGRGYHDRPSSRLGQGYTSISSPSELRGLVFRLQRVGIVGGLLNACVMTGGSTLQARSTTYYAADDISTSPTDYFFEFSGWTPSPSTLYYFSLELWDGFFDTSNHIDFIVETGAEATDPGQEHEFTYPSSGWTLPTTDVAFKLYSVTGAGAAAGGMQLVGGAGLVGANG